MTTGTIKKRRPLTAAATSFPNGIGIVLEAATKLQRILAESNPLEDILGDLYTPNANETVFDFLLRVFSSGIDRNERLAAYAHNYSAIDCIEILTRYEINMPELEPLQQKMAEMLGLNYSVTEDGTACYCDICKSARPLSNFDSNLVRQALNEAIIELWRYIDCEIVIAAATSRDPAKDGLAEKAFKDEVAPYRKLSGLIDAMNAIIYGDIKTCRRDTDELMFDIPFVDKKINTTVYKEYRTKLDDDLTGVNHWEHLSLFEACDKSYAELLKHRETSDHNIPRRTNFTYLLTKKCTCKLGRLGIESALMDERTIARELELHNINIVRDAEALRSLLETYRTPILRLATCYGEDVAQLLQQYSGAI